MVERQVDRFLSATGLAMDFVQVHDLDPRGFLAVDLRHVLVALGDRAERLWWTVCPVWEEFFEATGDAETTLSELEGTGRRIAGAVLVDLARRTVQVIWGEFQGFASDDAVAPDIVIRAVDSTYYEVHAADEDVLKIISASFQHVRDSAAADSRLIAEQLRL